ncbi:MAG TPA: MFS transporter [Solirubrobacteraceae bacterium]
MPSLPKSPRLRRILLAYTVNQLGTWFAYVALMLSVYDHTHSALAVAGLLVAGRLLPALLTPTLVAAVEMSKRRGGLSRLYMLEAVVAVAMAALLWHFWLPGLLVLVAIDGTAALTAGALLRATAARVAVEEMVPSTEILAAAGDGENGIGRGTPAEPGRADPNSSPRLADPNSSGPVVAAPGETGESAEEVAQREANAALNVAFTASVTLGPAVSGVIVAASGSPTALLIDAVSFMVCGALLMNLQVHASADAGSTSVRSRLLAAWGYLQTAPALRGLLATEALAIVFFASVEPVEVLFVKSTLNAGDRGFGFLTAAWGVGMVLGSLVFARAVHRPLRPMLTWGTLAVGLAYIGFSLSPTLAVACGAAVVGGMGNGVQWAALISSVQHMSPRELLGRLMGTVEGIGALCPAIGFVLGGVLAQLTSPRTAMLWIGVAAALCTGLFLRVTRKDLVQAAVSVPAGMPAELASEMAGDMQAASEPR